MCIVGLNGVGIYIHRGAVFGVSKSLADAHCRFTCCKQRRCMCMLSEVYKGEVDAIQSKDNAKKGGEEWLDDLSHIERKQFWVLKEPGRTARVQTGGSICRAIRLLASR